MGRTACTEPKCLYKGALYLLPYLTRSQLNSCWVLIVYRFTIHDKCFLNPVLMNQCTRGHVCSTYFRIPSKVPLRLRMVDNHQKCFGVVSLYFRSELAIPWILNVSGDKDLKNWVSTHFWDCISQRVRWHILIWKLLIFWLRGSDTCRLSRHLRYTCICHWMGYGLWWVCVWSGGLLLWNRISVVYGCTVHQ
jgi:hypothetical protein